jgi:hypothetical protein
MTASPPASPEARSRLYPGRALGLAAVWGLPAFFVFAGAARCPTAALFHHACPGCGMTRAMRLALHGDWIASIRMHPVAVPMVLSIALFAGATTLEIFRHGTIEKFLDAKLGKALVVFFVVVQLASIVIWTIRAAGHLGGPVPV